jgi:3-hydroxyacyl-CoA dehydrogenase
VNPVDYARKADVAVITVNYPPVNALSLSVRQGIMEGVERALADKAIKAAVIIGGGATFIAGADITEFGTPKATTPPRIRNIQEALEASAKPIIAAIHGTALGGGFELAMACHARVALASAKVGLPEVKLGLLPGAGGTVRLPRLAGPEVALDLITSGEHVPAQRALALGIVDAIVDDLEAGAIDMARKLAAGPLPMPTSQRNDRIRGVDPGLFQACREKIAKKARGQVAPFKIIDCIEAACNKPLTEALAFESDRFQELLEGDQRKALIHYFFAEREARKIPFIPAAIEPLPIRKIGVIGAGLMGGGIAMVFANAGLPVVLIDADEAALARGRAAIEKNYATSVARGSTPQAKMDKALSLIQPTIDYAALSDVDMVIEAVSENMALKQSIFARLDKNTPPRTILASNTSTLDIDQIASATSRPDKVVGVHFFAPANVMKLQENVRGAKSSPETIATVMALGKQIGKVSVLAGNCPGFIGNRMYDYYTSESEFLLEEGATPEQIDRVAESFGMAMGPAATRDLSGIEIRLTVQNNQRVQYPGERFSPIIQKMVEAGRLGQKNGKGFYRYEGRMRIPDPETIAIIEAAAKEIGIKRRAFTDDEIRDRLLHPLVNEGAKELEEGIALRAGDIDVVWVNGYGFPAHRGGPMFWGEASGLVRVVETARLFGTENGPRWRPSALLEELAKSGRGWDRVKDGKIV